MSQNKLYVGNLAYEVSEENLQEHFGQYGEIAEVKLIMDRETGRSKGFAFVTFVSADSADSALAANGVELEGRAMKVNLAREDSRRSGGGRGGHGGNGGGRW